MRMYNFCRYPSDYREQLMPVEVKCGLSVGLMIARMKKGEAHG